MNLEVDDFPHVGVGGCELSAWRREGNCGLWPALWEQEEEGRRRRGRVAGEGAGGGGEEEAEEEREEEG